MIIIKYLFFIFLLFQVSYIYKKPLLFFAGLIELGLVICASVYLGSINKILGYCINFIALLIFGIELIVYRFAGCFISLIMVTNLDSINGISGKFVLYLMYLIPFVIALVFPPFVMDRKTTNNHLCISYWIPFCLLFADIAVWNYASAVSPFFNSVLLLKNCFQRQVIYKKITNEEYSNSKALESLFYKETVGNYVSSPFQDKDPDIVLIFIEGLSQNIIDDSRNIMPYVQSFSEKSLRFKNYYNHTAATYRGLIGQLYSGHQYNNYDSNTLISLQKILHDNGYRTTFINTEPENTYFTNYLKTFEFDRLVTKQGSDTWLRDDEAYELLENVVVDSYENNIPDFTVIYTVGSHVTFDETKIKYGDSKNGLLNRFANVDYYFGRFMKIFDGEEKYKDLVVVVTTDHCTYEDEDFIRTFEPEYKRKDFFCDTIPFFIWSNCIDALEIDARGRNSLCLAPTLLDFLDIDGENYFLGNC